MVYQSRQEVIGIHSKSCFNPRVALSELCLVNVNLDDSGTTAEFLPIEASLLKA